MTIDANVTGTFINVSVAETSQQVSVVSIPISASYNNADGVDVQVGSVPISLAVSDVPDVAIDVNSTPISVVVSSGGGGGGGSAWGEITGTLSDQTDLQNALDGKQGTLVLPLSAAQGGTGRNNIGNIINSLTDVIFFYDDEGNTFVAQLEKYGVGYGSFRFAPNALAIFSLHETFYSVPGRVNISLSPIGGGGISSILSLENSGVELQFNLNGGGTLNLDGFTLTIPATGTPALLGIANIFTQDNRGKDFVSTRSGVITRDGNGRISQVAKTGGRTIIVTRDGNGRISSFTDGTNTWTFTRDVNNRVASWAVT